jgi:hypothetical protein
MFPCEFASCAPESGGDLIENKVDSVFIAEAACFHEILGMVEIHSSCALDYRFKNQCCYLIGMFAQCLFKLIHGRRIPLFPEFNSRLLYKKAYWKSRTECSVHAGHRVAYAHGIPSVAMIA